MYYTLNLDIYSVYRLKHVHRILDKTERHTPIVDEGTPESLF